MTTNEMLLSAMRAGGALNNPRIEAAFQAVNRHHFIPGVAPETAYTNRSIPIRLNSKGEAICAATTPSMLAYMLDQLQLEPDMNVLEIGTGTGYMAALLRNILGENGNLTSLEIEPDISDLARENLASYGIHDALLVAADGAEGYAPNAPYDRIIATTGIWDIPAQWINQLKPGGRIVVPLHLDGLQASTAFTMQDDGTLYADRMMPSAFVYIRGQAAGPEWRKRIGSTALTIITDDADQIDAVGLSMLLQQDYEAVQLSCSLDSEAYWYGLLPYIMLNETDHNIFALYFIEDNATAYGMDGEGFALLTPASACFVPYFGRGFVNHFAGADSFLEVEQYIKAWKEAGRPNIHHMRARFIPKGQQPPHTPGANAKVYDRNDHYLHTWMETQS